jgi:hypothetical protein
MWVKVKEVGSPIEAAVKELEDELRETEGGFVLLEELRESWAGNKCLELRAKDLAKAIALAAPSKRQASEKRLMDSLMRIGFSEGEAAIFAGQEPSLEGWRNAMLSEQSGIAPVAEDSARRHDALVAQLLVE